METNTDFVSVIEVRELPNGIWESRIENLGECFYSGNRDSAFEKAYCYIQNLMEVADKV